MKGEELYRLLNSLCIRAYKEGRKHQFDDDFPDVGMYFGMKYEDTESFKLLEKHKPKLDILGKVW